MRITAAEVAALSLSIKVALLSLIVTFPFGLLVGWLLAKRTFPGKAFLNTLVMLPLVLPPIVSGYLLLILLGKQGFIGRFIYQTFGIEIVFSELAVVIAVSVIPFPLLVRGIVTGMEAVPVELENAARTLGASPTCTACRARTRASATPRTAVPMRAGPRPSKVCSTPRTGSPASSFPTDWCGSSTVRRRGVHPSPQQSATTNLPRRSGGSSPPAGEPRPTPGTARYRDG